MTIREFAKSVDFKIVGKLHRIKTYRDDYYYLDDAGNEYYKDRNNFYIITSDGGVI